MAKRATQKKKVVRGIMDAKLSSLNSIPERISVPKDLGKEPRSMIICRRIVEINSDVDGFMQVYVTGPMVVLGPGGNVVGAYGHNLATLAEEAKRILKQ